MNNETRKVIDALNQCSIADSDTVIDAVELIEMIVVENKRLHNLAERRLARKNMYRDRSEKLIHEVVKLRNENKYLHSLIDGATKISPVELCFSYIDTQDSNTYCNICSLANNIGMEILDKKLYSESTRKDIWNPDNVEHVFRITLLPPIDNHCSEKYEATYIYKENI